VQLRAQIAPLESGQATARPEQGRGPTPEIGQLGDCPADDQIAGQAGKALRQILGALAQGLRILPAELADHLGEKKGLHLTRIEQGELQARLADFHRYPRKTRPAAQIQDAQGVAQNLRADEPERLAHMAGDDASDILTGDQVGALVPVFDQLNVAADLLPLRCPQIYIICERQQSIFIRRIHFPPSPHGFHVEQRRGGAGAPDRS